MCDCFKPCLSLLNRHGRVVYPCEEVQAMSISHVDPFFHFWPVSRSFYSHVLT
ncbi:Putative competence-damage inducible [Gossypium arboreum]|uniref:Putative competence-damage inducible n=1 Tax=Gossypium arboreum TaxID=29729 RepID=A0A0B0N1X5_GOSAR|nr:Putative competence-damage inducible [Gossypium arboreum]